MTTRIGAFCFRFRWLVLVAWLVILVAGVLSAGAVLSSLSTGKQTYAPESVRAGEVLDEAGNRGDQITALVESIDPSSRATRNAVGEAASEVRAISGVAEVDDPIPATDGGGVALSVTLSRFDDNQRDAEDEAVRRVSDRLRRLAGDLPGATVRLGGDAVIDREIDDQVSADLGSAELRALPLTIIVLVFVFGGLIAAGVPLLATLATMAGAFVVLLGFARVVTLDGNIATVVSLLGLGLSIDYGLLLVARYREELVPAYVQALTAGQRIDHSRRAEALARTWGTAGRTIMFSALIIAAALSGLLVLRVTTLQAMAAAGISVALVAMIAALTFTAALLGLFGRWIRPSKRSLHRANPQAASGDPAPAAAVAETEREFFARLASFTQRWPVPVAVVTVAALLAAGFPLLRATIRMPGLEAMPRTMESVAVAYDLAERYGRTTRPAVTVVARTDPASLDAWAARWRTDPEVVRVEPARTAGPNLATVVLAVPGDAQGAGAQALVKRVRADRPPGVESWVTGQAAVLVDVVDTLSASLPWGLAVTLLAMAALLFLMTGSVIVPLKAIVMGVVSLGASFGMLVLIFEDGRLSNLLDTQTVGGLSPFVLGIVFAFAFGLSMDYEVFLLGRVKEYVDAGHDTNTAVRRGLQHTGRIITSAAVLMLIVFGSFGAAQVGDIEEIGIGLFIVVLVDATVVRCLLVPATMTLLGRWNWWAPQPLCRLYDRLGLRSYEPCQKLASLPDPGSPLVRNRK